MQRYMWTVEDTHVITAVVSGDEYSWTVEELCYGQDAWDGKFTSPESLAPERLVKRIMVLEFDSSSHSVVMHADYPHVAGYVHNCGACENVCHCDGRGECVYCD